MSPAHHPSIALAFLCAALAPGAARAACTVTPTSPANGSTQVQSPTFRWTGDCAQYQLQFSPSGGFAGDVTSLSWQTSRTRRLAEDQWDSYQAGAWASGVDWRVRGRAADGTLAVSSARRVLMDPDLDDDGTSVGGGDCDDSDPAVEPGAPEACDGVDQDCDGIVPADEIDGDGDGLAACAGDCDDADPGVRPGAAEVCDGVDQDCDGAVDDVGLLAAGDLACAHATLIGDQASVLSGNAVSAAGDVDGDGYADLLIGGPGLGPDDLLGGAGWVVLGPVEGTVDLATADAVLVGEEAGDEAGHHLYAAGDVNGDGLDDVIVGAYQNDRGGAAAGAAYLVLGPMSGTVDLAAADAVLVGEAAGDRAGFWAGTAGDVNADGYGDLIVGAYEHDAAGSAAGAAYVVLGPVSGVVDLSLADAKLTGEAAGDRAGFSVASAGDYDGDGYGDLIVGAQLNDLGGNGAGAAYVVLGPVAGAVSLASAHARLVGEAAGDYAGSSVASAGDVNGDGFGDVIVGAHQNDAGGSGAGAAYLVLGPSSGTIGLASAHAKLVGEAPNDRAGDSAESAGDVNGDGYDDLVVGAVYSDLGGQTSGAAYLVLGPVSGTVDLSDADVVFPGETGSDFLGDSVAGVGDVNGDGYPDLLFGAPVSDSNGSAAGTSYLVLGGPT